MSENQLSYINSEGLTVFTSSYHKKRGTCCKSSCLHCPFGHTLKKNGLSFRAASKSDSELISKLMGAREWESILAENLQLILLKERVAGVMIKNHIVVKEVFLLPEFSHQGLDKDLIESYYFI